MIFSANPTLLRMRTLSEIAVFLRERLKKTSVTQRELVDRAGLARRTLTGMLSGEADYKVTTLMSVLDRLGYELTIVPKGAVAGLTPTAGLTPSAPVVKTRVQLARDRLEKDSDDDEPGAA
jgi:transcriptional regulator with XRE-family HTH domain